MVEARVRLRFGQESDGPSSVDLAKAPLLPDGLGMRKWMFLGLTVLLSSSLVTNILLYQLSRLAFLRYNAVLLDPLGLKEYSQTSSIDDLDRMKRRIVFFGDSRAEMWPPPRILPDSGTVYFNLGIGSQTTAQMALRFERHVSLLRPHVVILHAGMNDLRTVAMFPDRRDEIVKDCEEHFRQIISLARQQKAFVLVTTIFGIGDIPLQWKPFWSNEIQRAIDEVNHFLLNLNQEGVMVWDVRPLLEERGNPGHIKREYRSGLDHLNAQGYEALNQVLLGMLNGKLGE